MYLLRHITELRSLADWNAADSVLARFAKRDDTQLVQHAQSSLCHSVRCLSSIKNAAVGKHDLHAVQKLEHLHYGWT